MSGVLKLDSDETEIDDGYVYFSQRLKNMTSRHEQIIKEYRMGIKFAKGEVFYDYEEAKPPYVVLDYRVAKRHFNSFKGSVVYRLQAEEKFSRYKGKAHNASIGLANYILGKIKS